MDRRALGYLLMAASDTNRICCRAPQSRLSARFHALHGLAIRHLLDKVSGTPVDAVGASEELAVAAVSRPAATRNAYAASSIAKIAVSGWLMGSTPTRLTIDVIVPSASASTQAARCSSPRYGKPGSNTHPEAAPLHSGSDGVVSDGGWSISNAGG